MSNQNQKESTADMVVRLSHTEVHTRLLKARTNFPPIVGTGKGAYKDSQGNWSVIATKGDIKKCTVEPLAEQGLIGYFSQAPEKNTDNSIVFKYQLIHADSGQNNTWYIAMPTASGTFWDYGSAQTYAYRFLLGDLFNLIILDDVEEIDQDGTSAQLNLMYQQLCNEAVNVKSASELKVFKEETHKQFLDYIKKNKHQKYIDMATKQIHLIQARINE